MDQFLAPRRVESRTGRRAALPALDLRDNLQFFLRPAPAADRAYAGALRSSFFCDRDYVDPSHRGSDDPRDLADFRGARGDDDKFVSQARLGALGLCFAALPDATLASCRRSPGSVG